MKNLLILLTIVTLGVQVFGQTMVNPFLTNRNDFNQKDFISVYRSTGNDINQQIYGYDWIEALNQGSYSTIIPISDKESATNVNDGYVIIETGNFDGDDKDDVFYLLEKGGFWTYGASKQEPSFVEATSLYEFVNPIIPEFMTGTELGTFHSFPCVTIGDFDGNGIDECAVVWVEGPIGDKVIYIQIIVVNDDGGTLQVNGLPPFALNEMSISVDNYPISIENGDLNDDGTDELYISTLEENTSNPDVDYNAFVKVFDLSTDGNFNITPKGKIVYDSEHLGEDFDMNEGRLSGARTTCETVRPYTALDDEGAESIFAAVALSRQNEFENYDFFFPYHIICSADLNTLTVSPGPILDNGSGASYGANFPCESHKGDINGDAQDDIVILLNSYIVYTFADGLLELANNGGAGPFLDIRNNPVQESTDRFDIGDVDRDGLDDIVSQTRIYNEDEFQAEYYIEVFSSNEQFDLSYQGEATVNVEPSNSNFSNYGFSLGNLDGNDLRLGDPTVFDCSYFKPIIILETIPSHFDIIDGVEYDPMRCYELDNPNACGNAVVFESSKTNVTSSSVTLSSDFTTTTTKGGEAEFKGIKFESSIENKYGEQFEDVNTAGQSFSVSINLTANEDDFLHLNEYPFSMYEYPVLSQAGDIISWIVAAFPTIDPSEKYKSGNSLYNYLPNHEVGNILSYPKPSDTDERYYDKSEDETWLIYEFNSMPITNTNSINFTITQEVSDAISSSTTTTESISNTVGVSGFGFGMTLNEEIVESDLKIFSQTLTDAQSFSITGANVIGGVGVWDYEIKPAVYWTHDRAAKVGMCVDLSSRGIKWTELYGNQVDPALNLPYQYEYIHNTDYIEDNLNRTKSVRFDKINPQPNDVVTAFVRVFNYSLLSMTEEVTFSLFTEHPDLGGEPIVDLNGNTIFSSEIFLKDQGRTTVEVSFIVTNEMIAGIDNRIYVELDPENLISEIHENNNIGWTNMGYVCNTPDGGTLNIDEFVLKNEAIQFHVYPNPASSSITIDHTSSLQYLGNNLSIRVYDMSGKIVLEEKFQWNNSNKFTFDISKLVNGIYIYNVLTQVEEIHQGKLVIGR